MSVQNKMSRPLFQFLTGLNAERAENGRTKAGPAVEEGGRVTELPNINLKGQPVPMQLYQEARQTPGFPFVDDMLVGGGRVTVQSLGGEDGTLKPWQRR